MSHSFCPDIWADSIAGTRNQGKSWEKMGNGWNLGNAGNLRKTRVLRKVWNLVQLQYAISVVALRQ